MGADAEKARPDLVSETLGAFVAGSSWSEISPQLRREAKRALLNLIGCALGVAGDAPVETLVGLFADYSGPPRAGLIGRAERFDVLAASFINAVAANLIDYDDTHLETMIHPAAPVAPACLALGESLGASGSDVLHALVLGAEIECRMGVGVSPGHYPRGWHITSTCGVFGAAAASAKLLGLSAAETAHALGVAASQSAGVMENLPTAAKNVGVGSAARNGVLAALLAKRGYQASSTAIEGPLGWARAAGDEPRLDRILGGLGSRWEFLRNTYKPYPSGIVFHAVIEACLVLRQRHGLVAEEIEAVVVGGNSLFVALGERSVSNERDARVSIQHNAAVALLFGAAGRREFALEAVFDPRVVSLRSRVGVVLAPDLPRGAAHVELILKGGRTHAETVVHPLGSEGRPLTDRDIESKVRDLAAGNPASENVEAIIEGVWALDRAADIRPLMATMAGSRRTFA